MQTTEYEALARELYRQRAELLKEFAQTEAALRILGEERESEWTDSAVEERLKHLLTNLDGRDREALEEINAALQRLNDGSYGFCAQCGAPISFARLQAMPTARLCAVHAEMESTTQAEEDEEEVPESGPVPPDLALLSDEEIEEELWEQIRDDGRVESEELEIACRQGVVFLSGALPSRGQHSILMQLVTDVMGFQEIVDRTEVEQLAWQREDRDKAQGTKPLRGGIEEAGESPRELYGSEDTIESEGEVHTEPAPLGQPAPEEE
jgi:RNA polymerase-binding protein DksA